MKPRPWFAELIAFNQAVLEQGLSLALQFGPQHEAFAARLGPHLRHVIEHYEALLSGSDPQLVDYDHRARDRQLETDPQLAVWRIERLIEALQTLVTSSREAGEIVTVGVRMGLAGEAFGLMPSTLARELHFVASHAIHHYAVLRDSLLQQGITLPAGFGKAPETVRFERQAPSA